MNKFVLFDTEYTSWEGSQKRNWSGKGEYKELVKLSAIKVKELEDTLEVIDKVDIFFIPRINSHLSNYFRDLTGISNEDIQTKGFDFKEGMCLFFDFLGELPLYSYGNDVAILEENCRLYREDFESQLQTIVSYDIRKFFQNCGVETKNYTSGSLYMAFNLDLSGRIHDSSFDVLSIFESLRYLKQKSGDMIFDKLL